MSIEALMEMPVFEPLRRKRDFDVVFGGTYSCGEKKVYPSYRQAHRDGRHFGWSSYRCLACCKRLRRDAWHNGNN